MPKATDLQAVNMKKVSDAFMSARKGARHLDAYPGELPDTLDEAYSIQFRSISEWPKRVVGWKVGGIPANLQEKHKESRLGGAFFSDMIYKVSPQNDEIDMPCYEGGFAAIEPELMLEVGQTIRPGSVDPEKDDISDLISAVYIGVEIASSPLKTLNDLGPTSIISDFGNNNGIILGAEIPNWKSVDFDTMEVRTEISHGLNVTAMAGSTEGGPLGALAFLLRHFKRYGVTMKKGTLISSGAITGVHKSEIGDTSQIHFGDYPPIKLRLVKAQPRTD